MSRREATRVRRRLLQTRYGTVHATLAGEGGTPLVLLHMSPLSSGMFHRVLPLLAADRLVVCPDRIGFGDSDAPPRALTVPEIAEATLDAVDALGIAVFDVAGIHTGGCEAIELAAATAPGRVRRAAAIGLVVLTPEECARHRGAIVPPQPAADGSHLRWYWDYWLMVQRLRAGAACPDLAVVAARVLDHLRAGAAATATYNAVFDYDTAARLPLVRCPLLVLAPHDEFHAASLRAQPLLPPGARLVELPDVDYEAFEVAPGRLAEELLRFLDG